MEARTKEKKTRKKAEKGSIMTKAEFVKRIIQMQKSESLKRERVEISQLEKLEEEAREERVSRIGELEKIMKV